MMRLFLVLLTAVAGVIAAGCGSSSDDPGRQDPGPEPVGALRPVTGATELERSIKAGFTTLQASNRVAQALNSTASEQPGDTSNFTGTYTQEPNVDEFDTVRYDGSHLYIAPQRFFNCCLLAETPGSTDEQPAPPQRAIRILRSDPANGTASPVSGIPLDENVSVQGMYLGEHSLFALTSRVFYGGYGDFWTSIAIWAPEELGFSIYDTSDPAAPALELEATIDGVFVESRRIGDTVYIVSRYTPSIEGLDYPVTTAEQQAHNESILSGLTLNDLLPKITVNGETRLLVDPERCYVTSDDEEAGYPVITSITAVPMSNPEAFRTTCYDEDAYGVYVSPAAIYLTELRTDAAANRYFTRIHKFALTANALNYRGSAEVAGSVWRGGQADFRMNEFQGDLRVVASEFDWNSTDSVDHRLYVLRESATAPELEVIGQLPSSGHPEEIGKPNEALYGVRFLGRRAYAVTFERIDPLYVIDLADPTDPKLAGRLEVAGVSDFLHPVTDDLLLGLGIAASGGIKLELFDVSDLSQPLSRGSSVLGGRGSYSEARSDRHAFTFQADVDGVDRLAVPADLTAEDGTWEFVESGLYLYEIRDKLTPNLATLNAVGALVTHRAGDGTAAPGFERNRAFIHGDTVYYIRGEDVWAAFWDSPYAPNGAF